MMPPPSSGDPALPAESRSRGKLHPQPVGSPAVGGRFSNAPTDPTQHDVDLWLAQQAKIGDPRQDWPTGMQYSTYTSGQPTQSAVPYDGSPQMLAPNGNTMFASYPSDVQQPLLLGNHQSAGTFAPVSHGSFAPTTAPQYDLSEFQPSHQDFAVHTNESYHGQHLQSNTPSGRQPVQSFAEGNALNVNVGRANQSWVAPVNVPFQASPSTSNMHMESPNLASTQEYMNWIDISAYTSTPGISLTPSENATSVSKLSSAPEASPEQMLWQNVKPALGLSNAQMTYNDLSTLRHQNDQSIPYSGKQLNTSAGATQNTIILNDNIPNNMQRQFQNQQRVDESMPLYYWSQGGYSDIPMDQSNQSSLSVPTQHPPTSAHSNDHGAHSAEVQQNLLSAPTHAANLTSNHTLPNYNGLSLQYQVNSYPQQGTSDQYAMPINPNTLLLSGQTNQPTQLQSNMPSTVDSQCIAYAMSLPTGADKQPLQDLSTARSDAYYQHSAVAGKLKTLSLDNDIVNTSRSFGILSSLEHYLMAESRYGLGERKIVIHTPRVGQKSYGTEKRFLCPPPTASVIGLPWWQSGENGVLRPPAINISITGEHPVPASSPFWTTIRNKVYEETAKLRLNEHDRPFLGKVSNKGLHISDGVDPKDDKKSRSIKAIMSIHCRNVDGQLGQEIGSFESKEIKIVSKPSKKRSSARTSDLFLQHGTLITLFNRIKAQTSTTKFLAVSPNLRQLRGSDCRPLPLPADVSTTENAFVADHNSWDPFAIWLVDPNKPHGPSELPSSPNAPFPPPPDAVHVPNSKVIPIICFNNTVRLQCQATGLITPVMVIRKVEGPQTVQAFEGTRKDNDISKCPVNELPSDPVCQLHKIAFELYTAPVAPQSPVYGSDLRSPGSWLSCDQEGISFRPGISARNWTNAPSTPSSRSSMQLSSSLPPSPGTHMSALQPMTPRSVVSNGLPSAPTSPVTMYSPSLSRSNGGQSLAGDYFVATRHHSSASSTPYTVHSPLLAPAEDLAESNGPGPMRRRRTSSGASMVSIRPSSASTPIMRPPPPRKRGSQQSIHGDKKDNDFDGLQWTLDVAESATWTIVGAESKTYTFWIPPHVDKLSSPVTPFPTLTKYIPPGVAAEAGHPVDKRYPGQFTSLVDTPLATFYGSGLGKKPDGEALQVVYYGTQPAKHNEVRCQEVMNASVPNLSVGPVSEQKVESLPIFLVRTDGECIYPTPLTWTG